MPPLKGVTVSLEGGDRVLRFEKQTIYKLQARGQSIPELVGQLTQGNSNALVDLVWAGLLHETPALSVAGAVDLVPLPPPPALLVGVMRALLPVYGDDSKVSGAIAALEAALGEPSAAPSADQNPGDSGKKKTRSPRPAS